MQAGASFFQRSARRHHRTQQHLPRTCTASTFERHLAAAVALSATSISSWTLATLDLLALNTAYLTIPAMPNVGLDGLNHAAAFRPGPVQLFVRDFQSRVTPNETQRNTLIVAGVYFVAIAILWCVHISSNGGLR